MNLFKTIKSKLLALAIISIVALTGIVGGWWIAFNNLKVNGPEYERIVQVKDLVADILPPPEYILESYLVTSQALIAPVSELPKYQGRLAQLKTDFTDRHTFGKRQDLIPLSLAASLKHLTSQRKPFMHWPKVNTFRHCWRATKIRHKQFLGN